MTAVELVSLTVILHITYETIPPNDVSNPANVDDGRKIFAQLRYVTTAV